MQPNTIIQQDITATLGLSGLTDEEKIVFLSEIGDVVLEAALLRLAADLTDEQQVALEQYLETEPEADALMNHLLQHHQNFETILQEEIVAFKEDALAVLGNAETTTAIVNEVE